MRKRIIRATILVAATAALMATSACNGTSKYTEQYKDAPVANTNDDPATLLRMPDGYSNVATKCDGYGNRVYVLFHNNNPYGGVAVVPNAKGC